MQTFLPELVVGAAGLVVGIAALIYAPVVGPHLDRGE